MTAKTMAEEIMLHSPIGRDEQGQYCKACNHRYGYAADRLLHQRASAHIADALSAAGFGLVADTKAEAALETAEDILAGMTEVCPDECHAIGFVEGYRDACVDTIARAAS